VQEPALVATLRTREGVSGVVTLEPGWTVCWDGAAAEATDGDALTVGEGVGDGVTTACVVVGAGAEGLFAEVGAAT
jgi:hypothetical protein